MRDNLLFLSLRSLLISTHHFQVDRVIANIPNLRDTLRDYRSTPPPTDVPRLRSREKMLNPPSASLGEFSMVLTLDSYQVFYVYMFTY